MRWGRSKNHLCVMITPVCLSDSVGFGTPQLKSVATMPTLRSVERRIARRFAANCVLDIWIPRRGVLGRAKTAELPADDLSVFGASVVVEHSDGLKKGQVVKVTLNDESTSAIVRNELPVAESTKKHRCGLEFVKPSDAFIAEVTQIINQARAMHGSGQPNEELWLRSA